VLARQASALELGDPAPPLNIAKWVKGDSVEMKPASKTVNGSKPNGGKVYVLEFWATWCAPCRASMPHLSKLQKEYKDKGLVVIGITDENESLVRSFVKQMGKNLGYTIAVDKRQATSRAYMGGVGAMGIPHTFVIDQQGRLAWHGSPFTGLDQVVEKVVAGTYNLEARKLMNDYFTLLFRAQQTEKKAEKNKLNEQARKVGQALLKTAADDVEVLDLLAWNILSVAELKNPDVELAATACQAALKLSKGKDPNVLETYAKVLWTTGRKSEAIAQQKKAIEIADNTQRKEALQRQLKSYENSQ